jgi:hypothetical protein
MPVPAGPRLSDLYGRGGRGPRKLHLTAGRTPHSVEALVAIASGSQRLARMCITFLLVAVGVCLRRWRGAGSGLFDCLGYGSRGRGRVAVRPRR